MGTLRRAESARCTREGIMKKENKKQHSQHYSKSKIFIILGCVIIAIFVLIFLYWYIVDPFVDYFVEPPHYETTAMSIYSSGEYLTFSDGKAFENYLVEVKPEGEIVYFYHRDNYGEDNPIHGRQIDLYALDIKLEETVYKSFKVQMIQDCLEQGTIDSYNIYLDDVIDEDGNQFLFLCNDEKYMVRFMMLTDAPDLKDTVMQPFLHRFAYGLSFE